MYSYEDVGQIHLEITDKCNAACPQCPRNDHGGPVNPELPLTELTLQDVQDILPPHLLRQLRHLYACGNYGDPIVARDCGSIFQYLRASNPNMVLGLHTNGGARSVAFWQDLARVMPKHTGYVRFGIDGLEDTNHIYRRNVRWSVLMRNVQAFIAAGGNAEWNYLVFRHNEHQVDQARELAHQLGFSLFNVKKTGRFVDATNMELIELTPIKGRSGEVVGRLERPVNPAYQNRAFEGLQGLKRRYGDMQRYLDEVEIHCKVRSEGSLYISSEGYVLPCCWLAGHVRGPGGAGRRQLLAMLEQLGGTDHIDARRRSIRAIVEDAFFQRLLPQSWDKPGCGAGRLLTCARVCGQEFDRRSAQNSVEQLNEAQSQERHEGRPTARRDDRLKLAENYRDGAGVAKNYEQALRWYLAVLDDQASPAIKYQVGDLYRTGGPGLPKDEDAALHWYREAADQGSHWAQYQLGEAYRTGRGVSQDMGEAIRFFEMAALAGNHWAQYRLGESFRTGQGKPQDDEAASDWLCRSAEQGNRRAKLALHEMCRQGNGASDPNAAAGSLRRGREPRVPSPQGAGFKGDVGEL